jgi:hypothetical protein
MGKILLVDSVSAPAAKQETHNTMGFFGRTASDDEWLKAVKPFYIAARTFVKVVKDAVTEVNMIRDNVTSWHKAQRGLEGKQEDHGVVSRPEMGSHEERARRVADACTNLASVRKTISTLPGPSSAEGRRARKSLEQALRLYLRCAKRASKFLRDLGGKFGRNYARGRICETKWTAIEATSLGRMIENAGKKLETAAIFIDVRIPAPSLRTPNQPQS